jgi:hypothetical protein
VCSKGRRGERAWQRVANGGEYRHAAMLLHTYYCERTACPTTRTDKDGLVVVSQLLVLLLRFAATGSFARGQTEVAASTAGRMQRAVALTQTGGSFDADGRDGVDWRCRDQAKGMLRWGRQAQEADSPGRRRQGVLLVES